MEEERNRNIEHTAQPAHNREPSDNGPTTVTQSMAGAQVAGTQLAGAQLAGAQLGPYKIEAFLGAGGMGQVYRAVDTRLDRRVAIKIAAGQFSGRFEREARAIAALNHPHICTVYDVGSNYLVMELLEGETLDARLRKGPLPLEQVSRYGAQIAGALAAAHAKSITHRDLKPGNIMLAKSGVKVLDFGLAKSAQDTTLTASHAVLGTPAYMAPEQIAGEESDARTDIYALGLVLYEMASGKRMPRNQPSALENLPMPLAHVIERCVAEHPGDRWQAVADVKLELEWAQNVPAAPSAKPSRKLPYFVAALALLIAATLAAVLLRRAPPAQPVVRSYIPPPGNSVFNFAASQAGAPALSPDGRRLVFGAIGPDGKNQLWLRSLDSPSAQPLPGTEEAYHPFWSPDSASIGFFTLGKMKRLEVSGGAPVIICDVPDGRGGAWNSNGTIVFSPSVLSVLYRVPASGGSPVPATSLDTSRLETGHRMPWFLPDGRHFLYEALAAGATPTRGVLGSTIRLASLDSAESKVVIEVQSSPQYAQGYLLFARERTLIAQKLDLGALAATGEAIPLAERIQGNSVRPAFSVSGNGLLAYQAAGEDTGIALAWFDRNGKRIANLGSSFLAGIPSNVQLSPDRKTAAINIQEHGKYAIWLIDPSQGRRTRFTFGSSSDQDAVWSPDGRTILFSSNRNGHFDLYRKPADGGGAEELVYADGVDKYATSWSPDEKFVLYTAKASNASQRRLWGLFLKGERKPFTFGGASNDEVSDGAFSPDGRWIAYTSFESGRAEVYIAAFSGAASPAPGKRQVSTAGGFNPRWRRDGNEIFFQDGNRRLMAAEVFTKGDTREIRVVRPLFPVVAGGLYRYDVSADGQRFLVFVEPPENAALPLTLIQNWTATMRK